MTAFIVLALLAILVNGVCLIRSIRRREQGWIITHGFLCGLMAALLAGALGGL